MTSNNRIILALGLAAAINVPVLAGEVPPQRPATLDLRVPMRLAANAIPPRLDATRGFRPFFLMQGKDSVPHTLAHMDWDVGDMTGRYIETLINARTMGITSPELSLTEDRLGRYLLSVIGPDGVVHIPDSGAVDHQFAQGSALFGLLAWYETTGDPTARGAIDRMVRGLRAIAEDHGDHLTYAAVKLEQSPGSHLAGYQIFPLVRCYELTGSLEALSLAEGLTRWVIEHDPTIGPDGEITKPLSWEGHVHSWFESMAGSLRAARVSPRLDHAKVLRRGRAVYEWVKRTNGSDFGWYATFPTHSSCETCGIASAIRLLLELAQSGYPEYFNDIERSVRNQVIEAQFRDLAVLAKKDIAVCPHLLGTFDSQSRPNSHLFRGGFEDNGTVEGCCLNGGTRALFLAWDNIVTQKAGDVFVNLALSRDSPWAEVIGYQPYEGRVDVRLRYRARRLHVRVPDWADHGRVVVRIDDQPATGWSWSGPYAAISGLSPGQVISVSYPLRRATENVTVGGQQYRITWRGDTVIGIEPPGERDRLYQRAAMDTDVVPMATVANAGSVPDTYFIQDAAVAAAENILARLDTGRGCQPFFRIYPFADPPYASHEKWDDGDMSGRYVEALIMARRMTGLRIDPREPQLRQYLAGLLDPKDGLAYTQQTDWTPRRACLFSQSCVMLGLLAWYDETGSEQVRAMLDRHVDGLMRLAVKRDNYTFFPKYEYDGKEWIDEPKGKEPPAWYGGRLLCPLVEYDKRFPRPEVKEFIEKLARYCMEVNPSIGPDGEVRRGEGGWWGHLHGTQDMVAGIAEYARLNNKKEWIAWARRIYEWVGRTQTARFGWIADCSGSHICESCGIAARFRLGLALYRAGVVDPFGEMDRFTRNQLMENQFTDLSFLKPLRPDTPATPQKCYRDVDRMILGTFQCWGTANDLIGHDDIEGCGAGGGMQALYFAWRNAVEWKNDVLSIHLLFNRRVALGSDGPVGPGTPLAAEILSDLPYAGRVSVLAHRPLKLRMRLPDGADAGGVRVSRKGTELAATAEAGYIRLPDLAPGEQAVVTFPLRSESSDEQAAGKTYRVAWKGSTVLGLEPRGEKMPLYTNRAGLRADHPPLCLPRYP